MISEEEKKEKSYGLYCLCIGGIVCSIFCFTLAIIAKLGFTIVISAAIVGLICGPIVTYLLMLIGVYIAAFFLMVGKITIYISRYIEIIFYLYTGTSAIFFIAIGDVFYPETFGLWEVLIVVISYSVNVWFSSPIRGIEIIMGVYIIVSVIFFYICDENDTIFIILEIFVAAIPIFLLLFSLLSLNCLYWVIICIILITLKHVRILYFSKKEEQNIEKIINNSTI